MALLPFIHRVTSNLSLSSEDARIAMTAMLSGQASEIQIAAFLVALKMKGETAAELAGFARAMREHMIVVDTGLDVIDSSGTGGDGSGTFNISTATALVLAGAGAKVAKHGNRSLATSSGSADVLEALGVRIALTPDEARSAIQQIGIGFLFAPKPVIGENIRLHPSAALFGALLFMTQSPSRRVLANAIRFLAMDAVQQANSGHPGAPMGMADIAQVLWRDHLKHNPNNPTWADRDRFVLSNGHGSMLLYALLHLSGYDLPIEELKNFRQLHSKTPGHPEYGMTPGVETTTGPLGQGLANAVGMAISQKILQAAQNYPVPKHL